MKKPERSPALWVIYGLYCAIALYTIASFFFEDLLPPVWWGWYLFSFTMAEVGKATFILMIASTVVLIAAIIALFLPQSKFTVLLNVYLILFCAVDVLACLVSMLDYTPGAVDYAAPLTLDAVLIGLIITAMILKRKAKRAKA